MTAPAPPASPRAHFSREFRRALGDSPHAYLLTRRLERAAALLRTTDRSVADVCFSVGLQSLGSFTTSFTRTFGRSPTAYRVAFPPASRLAVVSTCVQLVYGRPQRRTFREDTGPEPTWHRRGQVEALDFYTQKLGMEVRADVTLPEMGDFRWLSVGPVGQDDVAIV